MRPYRVHTGVARQPAVNRLGDLAGPHGRGHCDADHDGPPA